MDIKALTGGWFFPDAPVTKVADKVWQVGDDAYCKLYDDKQALCRELRLLGFLQERGIPTPSVFQSVDELDWQAVGGQFLCLSHRMPGAHINDPLADPEHSGALYGRVLRRLHDALAGCPFADMFPDSDFAAKLEGWFCESNDDPDAHAEARDVAAALRRLSPVLPRQLIHRDPHSGNFLFTGDDWTGALDFELVRTGFRLLDIAYLASSVLMEGWQDEAVYRKWLRFVHAYLAAYGPTPEERQAFAVMLRAIALLFAGFWPDAEHRATEVQAAFFFREHEAELPGA